MFLATTAIDDFWDKDKKILFLGSWCLLPKNRSAWEPLDYIVMPSPWQNRQAFYEAGKYTYDTYQYLLDNLTNYLNSVHNVDHSKRFWQIIIGTWLLHFTEAFYDRYICLQAAVNNHSPLSTIVLDESCYITPQGTYDFFTSYCEDFYNIQLYSQIVRHFDVSWIERKALPEKVQSTSSPTRKKYLSKIISDLLSCFSYNGKIVLWDSCWSIPHIIRFFFTSNFSILPVFEKFNSPRLQPVELNEKRRSLAKVSAKDHFTHVLLQSLPINFPILFLEGYADFTKKLFPLLEQSPKALFSTIGWYWNEKLKYLAAHWSEKGTLLLGAQHGGLYGTAKWMPPEKHEMEITDFYFTWGWKKPDNIHVIPAPNPKISNLMAQKRKDCQSNYFLYVGMCHPRYLYRFFSCPVGEMFDEYFEWRNRFWGAMLPEKRREMLLRLYPHDYDRSQKKKIIATFKEMRFDNLKKDYLYRVKRCKIVIIDHPVTTMLESIALNHPTILFWNSKYWELRPEVKTLFQELARVNILHSNPEDAADFFNSVCNDPLQWWNEVKTQLARKRFVKEYAWGDKKWSTILWNELQNIFRVESNLKAPSKGITCPSNTDASN